MPLDPGASIGDYKVLALLGSGGMGQVYKVQNLLSNRIEAIKVLVPDLRSQGDLAERFLREMQVHASLVHPNIAAMHTALRLENQLVMVMEFVEGITLEDRLREGSLAVRQCIDYASQMLSALAYAHKQGVVHRDIKPSNVMVTPEGTVKVMDFGLAAGVADKRLTRPGTLAGSLYYMSPEQVRGDACSAQTDIYSAGLTLYEMLTGVRGIHGDSEFALMNAQLTESPEPPARLNPAIPSSLSEVVVKSLAKSPADRFGSASEFSDALKSAEGPPAVSTDLEPTRVLTPKAAFEPAPIPPPAPARKSWTLIFMLTISVALIGGLAVYRTLSSRTTPSTPAAVMTVTPSQPAPISPAQPPPTATVLPAKKTPLPAAAQPTPASPVSTTPDIAAPAEEAEQPEPPVTRPKREAARREIGDLLDQLKAAYSSRDFAKLATLWPSATPEARGRFAMFFTQFRPLAFTFRLNGDPTVSGTGATVRDHFERNNNKKGPAERTLVIRMSRGAATWVIESINFAPIGAK